MNLATKKGIMIRNGNASANGLIVFPLYRDPKQERLLRDRRHRSPYSFNRDKINLTQMNITQMIILIISETYQQNLNQKSLEIHF